MSTRVDILKLENFRSFAELSLSFHPELTVLVAPNGGGKTAILDALAHAWEKFVAAVSASQRDGRLNFDDVRNIVGPERTMEMVLPTQLLVTGMVANTPVRWSRRIVGVDEEVAQRSSRAKRLLSAAASLRREVIEYTEGTRPVAPTLPALCYYGTGRLWNRRTRTERDVTSRFGGYANCLSSASSFSLFQRWFRRFAYEAQSELSSHRASPHHPRERLAAVSVAVGRLLAPTGWQQLEWDFAEDALSASHPEHGRLPVRLLSDGIRNMIGLCGDLAHRCVRLNPHFGKKAASMTPGVVLIDEVDMHLHPAWQQIVIASLREAFPLMQFIVTTHSHLMVSTVPSECVRILQSDGSVSRPSLETEGYDSPFTLGVVFGVDSTPPVQIARQLSRYRALLEQGQGDSEEARALRDRLDRHFGAQHPAILAVESMRRLQDFKARMAAKREGH